MLLAHSSGLPAYEKLFLKAKTTRRTARGRFHYPALRRSRHESRVQRHRLHYSRRSRWSALPTRALTVSASAKYSARWGWSHTAFNPPAAWRASIPPTADDRSFRKRIIQGEVQDENASVLGGVAGHAGLFATAEDLATFAHVLLQTDGQPSWFRPETLALFTRRETAPAGTSRALGWDTPSSPSQSGKYFSASSFGHLGYTGTSLWIDPERQLSITLLTNRTWPDCSNQSDQGSAPRVSRRCGRSAGTRKRTPWRKTFEVTAKIDAENLSRLATEQPNRASADLDLEVVAGNSSASSTPKMPRSRLQCGAPCRRSHAPSA